MILEPLRKFFFTWFFTSLDRYFYKQLLVNYIIGVLFFSSIIMINELYYIMRYYFEQNVPLFHVMSMMGSLMPFLISFSVPFGVLPAYLLLMGQLSQDSEIVAMRACGISQFRIMLPGIMFGALIMIFAYNFKNTIEAFSNAYYLQLKSKVLSQKPVVQLLDNVFLNIGTVQLSFDRTSQVEGGEDILHNVYAVDVENRQTIRAEEGRIFVSPDNPEHYVIKFVQGDLNQITFKTNYITNRAPASVNQPLNLPNLSNAVEVPDTLQNVLAAPQSQYSDDFVTPSVSTTVQEEFYLSSFGLMTLHNYVWLPGDDFYKGPDTYSYKELQEVIDENPENIANRRQFQTISSNYNLVRSFINVIKFLPIYFQTQVEDQRDLIDTTNYIAQNMPIIQGTFNNLKTTLDDARAKLPNHDVMKLYDKLALPFVALVFAILSLPLGMFSARSGRGEGLSISLVVVLVFYGFKSAIENMISQNRLIPEMIWIPSLVFAVIAMILYVKKLQE